MVLELDMQKVDTFTPALDKILSFLKGKKLDILVNNAGILGCTLKNAEEDSYDSALDTNLKGPFFLSKVIAEYMKIMELRAIF